MIKTCPHCQEDYRAKDYRQKFCSRSCSASFYNAKDLNRKRLPHKLQNCIYCGEELRGKQVKYCSRKCSGANYSETIIKEWLDGTSDGSDPNGTLKGNIRRWLIEQAGNKCSWCGWAVENPYINKVILCVDHKDGDWENNRPDNLQVLCYNCHTLTPNFGSLNKNGKSNRRPGTYRSTGLTIS